MSYSVACYSYVSFSGLISSSGEESYFSAIVYLQLCGFCSEELPLFFWSLG